jgi:hypothetical protein
MRLRTLAAFAVSTSLAGTALAAPADSDWHVVKAGRIQRYAFETGSGPTAGTRASTATYLRSAGYNGSCCDNTGLLA